MAVFSPVLVLTTCATHSVWSEPCANKSKFGAVAARAADPLASSASSASARVSTSPMSRRKVDGGGRTALVRLPLGLLIIDWDRLCGGVRAGESEACVVRKRPRACAVIRGLEVSQREHDLRLGLREV